MTGLDTYGRRYELDTLRDQFAPAATDLELEHFALVCRHLELDPYVDQICLIGRNRKIKDSQGRDRWQMVHKPQITVAGRRAIAGRTGRLAGIEGPQFCGPRRYRDDGSKIDLDWDDVWDGADNPYAARCLVYVAGWDIPVNGTVKWGEFAQTVDAERQRLSPLWQRMPSHMLGKVAESLALRRAFPEVDAAVSYVDAREGFDADDAAVIAEAEAVNVADRSVPAPVGEVPAAPTGTDPDRVPDALYDDLPEARGWR
jgi:hypothetical protein